MIGMNHMLLFWEGLIERRVEKPGTAKWAFSETARTSALKYLFRSASRSCMRVYMPRNSMYSSALASKKGKNTTETAICTKINLRKVVKLSFRRMVILLLERSSSDSSITKQKLYWLQQEWHFTVLLTIYWESLYHLSIWFLNIRGVTQNPMHKSYLGWKKGSPNPGPWG